MRSLFLLGLLVGVAHAQGKPRVVDRWMVVDDLLLKGEKKKALALAKDTPRLLAYIEGNKPRPEAALALAVAIKTLNEKKHQAALDQLARIDSGPADLTSVRALLVRAHAFFALGRAQEAVPFLEESLKKARAIGWGSGHLTSLQRLSHCARLRQDWRRVVEIDEEIIAFLKPLKGPAARKLLATTYSDLAVGQKELGDPDKALAALTHALSLFEKLGDRRRAAATANNIGLAYTRKDEYARALGYLGRALKYARELKWRSLIAAALVNSGIIHLRLHRLEKALTFGREDVGSPSPAWRRDESRLSGERAAGYATSPRGPRRSCPRCRRGREGEG